MKSPRESNPIEYRLATLSDLEAIALLHARSWRENYRGSFLDAFLDGDLPAERRRVWRDRLDHPPENQFVQVAIRDLEVIGFVCTYGDHDPKWGSLVDNLHVAREARGSGVGRQLMAHSGSWLADSHPEVGVYLWVLESNQPARGFYERLGARSAEVTNMETHGGAMVRSCRYVWRRPVELSAFRPGQETG